MGARGKVGPLVGSLGPTPGGLPSEVLGLILAYTRWRDVARLAAASKGFAALGGEIAIIDAPYVDRAQFSLAMRISLGKIPFTMSWTNTVLWDQLKSWMKEDQDLQLGLIPELSPILKGDNFSVTARVKERFKTLLRMESWKQYVAGITAVREGIPAALHRRNQNFHDLGPRQLDEYAQFYHRNLLTLRSQGKVYDPALTGGQHTMVYNVAWLLGLAHAMQQFDLTIPLSPENIIRNTKPGEMSALFREVVGLLQAHYVVTSVDGRTILAPRPSAAKATFEQVYFRFSTEGEEMLLRIFGPERPENRIIAEFLYEGSDESEQSEGSEKSEGGEEVGERDDEA